MTVDASRYRWRQPGPLGTILRIMLLVAGLGSMITSVIVFGYLRRHAIVLHIPERGSNEAPTIVPWPSRWIGVFWIPSLVSQATVVVWLVWQHQVTANLWARGYRDLRTSPGWAVGWWFVPVANFGMPLVSMLEVDRRSAPDGLPRRASPLLGWWWAAWIGYSLVPLIGVLAWAMPTFVDWAQTVNGATRTVDLTPVARSIAPWILVAGILNGVAAVLAVLVVGRIDDSQAALGRSGSPVPARPDR